MRYGSSVCVVTRLTRRTQLVTKGLICARPNCKVCLHQHCYNVYSEKNKTCLTCQQDWSGDAGTRPVGEAAAPSGSNERRRTRRANSEDDVEEEIEEEEMDESQATSRGKTQSQKRTQTRTQTTRGKAKRGRPKKAAVNGHWKNKRRSACVLSVQCVNYSRRC